MGITNLTEVLVKGTAAAHQRANEILKRVADIDNPVVIEVGVNKGILSQVLLGARKDLELHMVDSWRGEQDQPDHYKETKDRNAFRPQSDADRAKERVYNMAKKFNSRAFIYENSSVLAAEGFSDKFADIIFIDADHSYEGCKADIEAYTRVTRKWIGGHDYRNPQPQFNFKGVDRAVEEAFGSVEVGKNVTWFKCLYV